MPAKESIEHMAKITLGKHKYQLEIHCRWVEEKHFETTVQEDTYHGPPDPIAIVDLIKPGFSQGVGFDAEEMDDKTYSLKRDSIREKLEEAIGIIAKH